MNILFSDFFQMYKNVHLLCKGKFDLDNIWVYLETILTRNKI